MVVAALSRDPAVRVNFAMEENILLRFDVRLAVSTRLQWIDPTESETMVHRNGAAIMVGAGRIEHERTTDETRCDNSNYPFALTVKPC